MENTQTNNILMVKDLRVSYSQEAGSVFRPKKDLDVLKGVSFSIREGEVMGLVGESGCGKSTLSKALLGLIPKYEGVIVQKSEHPQMIFQDPFSSLNPAKKVGWILEEPLRLNTGLNRAEREKKVSEMLRRVGLEEKLAQRCFDCLNWQSPTTWVDEQFIFGEWVRCEECHRVYDAEEHSSCPHCGNEQDGDSHEQ